MSIITDLIEHRTKLLEMKTELLSHRTTMMGALALDADIAKVDHFIEMAIKTTESDNQD